MLTQMSCEHKTTIMQCHCIILDCKSLYFSLFLLDVIQELAVSQTFEHHHLHYDARQTSTKPTSCKKQKTSSIYPWGGISKPYPNRVQKAAKQRHISNFRKTTTKKTPKNKTAKKSRNFRFLLPSCFSHQKIWPL